MRNVPGWLVGALGVGVVVGAFVLGGHLTAAPRTDSATTANSAGLMVDCEPGQRAVVRPGTTPGAALIACVSVAASPAFDVAASPAFDRVGTMRPVSTAPRAVTTRPAVVSRAPVPRTRSVGKSVAIIGGATAAGAVIGGIAKGKKGAVIGGIAGGGAATIWDQVTRRKRR